MLPGRILFVYILREQVKVLVLAVAGTILVMNFGALVVHLQRFSLPIGALLRLLPYQVPLMFPWVVPLAMLMSTTLAYGRLTSDNEILAMQMAGMHLIRPVLPAVLLGVTVMLGLFAVNDHLLPWCRQREYEVFVEESEQILLEVFRTKRKLRAGDYLLTWQDFRDRTIHEITVRQREGDKVIGEYKAATATYGTDGENITLSMVDITGTRFVDGADISVAQRTERIPMADVITRAPAYRGLTTREILRELDAKYGPEVPLPKDAKAAAIERAYRERQSRRIWLRIHQRFSLAFSALAFTLVGVAMGILARQSHMLSAFFLGCLPVMLLYYPVFLLGHSLADDGTISAAAACWTPAGLLGAIGAGLLGWLFVR